MSMLTDQVADLLTRIRNAGAARKRSVTIPASSIKKEVTRILHEHHFIDRYAFVEDKRQGQIKILLKYDDSMKSVIRGLERVSTPGRRTYRGVGALPRVLNGMGMAIVSTPKGVMTDSECRKLNVGGEVIAKVW
jgi:small subunit ribosomal protein S8